MCKSPSPSPKLCSSSSLPHTLKVLAAQCSNRSRKWCFSQGERLGDEVFAVWNRGPGHLFANPLYQSAYTVKLRFQELACQCGDWMNFGLKVETTLSEAPRKVPLCFTIPMKESRQLWFNCWCLMLSFSFQRLNETLYVARHIFHSHWFNHSLQKQESWFHTIHCLLFGSLIKARESVNSTYLLQ